MKNEGKVLFQPDLLLPMLHHLHQQPLRCLVIVLHGEDGGPTPGISMSPGVSPELALLSTFQGDHLRLHVIIDHLGHHIGPAQAAAHLEGVAGLQGHLEQVDPGLEHREHQVLGVPTNLKAKYPTMSHPSPHHLVNQLKL